jgi:tRNA-specific 2-thiouridylase
LLRAKDPIKDQTFFLSSLSNEQLKNVMFPLGSICKNDVKKIAADAGMDQFANKVEVRNTIIY